MNETRMDTQMEQSSNEEFVCCGGGCCEQEEESIQGQMQEGKEGNCGGTCQSKS